MSKLIAARDALNEEARSLAAKRASQEARLAKLQAVACIRNGIFFLRSGSHLKRHSVSGSFLLPLVILDPDPISNVILYLDSYLPLVIPDPDPISKVI
jgi:hypothetical protein